MKAYYYLTLITENNSFCPYTIYDRKTTASEMALK